MKFLVIWTYQQLQDHSIGPLREKNKEENTALHQALINKYQVVGCNLALESKYNEMAKFFILKDPDISYYLNKVGKSPLYMAAAAGDVELVKLMIITNHLPDVNGKSIVYVAIFGAFITKNIGNFFTLSLYTTNNFQFQGVSTDIFSFLFLNLSQYICTK